ncbi:hypothetical protein Nepgr_007630 [Nepenthes gracilis]|uniref:FRIGIDA-like protein n=1 Tax=Nepenthes gracilis TaxID=150966 RepID=A0AAD3XIM2_NEPGR|nr:hypothetical protein Nepgr_007630 [Nepenthes gracilis]
MRERARSLMVAWKGKRKKEEIVAFEALMFLQLLASFRLGEEFDKNELLGFVEVIVYDPQSNGKLKQVGKCCQVLGLVDKAPELVRRLAKRGQQLHAVKFIHELKLADKCRPVPLLKSYLNQARKGARKLQKKTNMRINSGAIDTKDASISHGEVLSKEFTALKTVHKFIKEYNLESEYPIEVIEKRMKMVELQMAKKKSAVPQPEQQQNQSSSDN